MSRDSSIEILERPPKRQKIDATVQNEENKSNPSANGDPISKSQATNWVTEYADIKSRWARIHDSYPTKLFGTQLLDWALDRQRPTLRALSRDPLYLFDSVDTTPTFKTLRKDARMQKAASNDVKISIAHFGAPNLHDEDQKEPSLKELTNSQNIDVTKPRSKETPFVSAEVRGSSAKGASLEHFLPQGDNLKALGMCGWTRQFTSYVSPGGGFTSPHIDHSFLGYILNECYGIKIWFSFPVTEANTEHYLGSDIHNRIQEDRSMVLNDGSLLRHIQGYTGEMCVTVLTPHLTAYMPAGSVHFVLTLDGDAAVCGFPVFDPTESKAMRETAALRLARSEKSQADLDEYEDQLSWWKALRKEKEGDSLAFKKAKEVFTSGTEALRKSKKMQKI